MLRPVFRVTFSWVNTSWKRSRTSPWLRKVLARYIHLTPAQSICRKVASTALYISHGSSPSHRRSVLSLDRHAIFSLLKRVALFDSSQHRLPHSICRSVAWQAKVRHPIPEHCHTMLFWEKTIALHHVSSSFFSTSHFWYHFLHTLVLMALY